MCAKCFAVIFNGLFYIIAVCAMAWNSLYFKVRKLHQSPYISMSSLNAICLEVWKKVIAFLNFLEFTFCMFRFGSLTIFTMVQTQKSKFELHRWHLRATAQVSHSPLSFHHDRQLFPHFHGSSISYFPSLQGNNSFFHPPFIPNKWSLGFLFASHHPPFWSSFLRCYSHSGATMD